VSVTLASNPVRQLDQQGRAGLGPRLETVTIDLVPLQSGAAEEGLADVELVLPHAGEELSAAKSQSRDN
jgi:hypothetical protein